MTPTSRQLLEWADPGIKGILPDIEEVRPPRTLGDQFTAKKSQVPHHVGHIYSVDLDLPWNRKAAGDPIILQSATYGQVAPRGTLTSFLDLIPEVPVTDSLVTYAQEIAFGIGVPVASGGIKTAIALDYLAVNAPIETLAGWIKVTLNALDDSNQAGYDINNRLLVAVRKTEEQQVVAGTGTTPQLIGLLSATAGIASAATIVAGLAAVRGAGYTPNGILLNPVNTASAITAAGTSYAYDPFRGVEIMYGVPVFYSNAVTANTGIVGDFTNGCVIYRRQDATVIVGHVNDDIVKNLVTLVGESRLAFCPTQPFAFNKVTLT